MVAERFLPVDLGLAGAVALGLVEMEVEEDDTVSVAVKEVGLVDLMTVLPVLRPDMGGLVPVVLLAGRGLAGGRVNSPLKTSVASSSSA